MTTNKARRHHIADIKADATGCAPKSTASADAGSAEAAANLTTKLFKVYGNCGMCKRKIEAPVGCKGIHYANWDAESN